MKAHSSSNLGFWIGAYNGFITKHWSTKPEELDLYALVFVLINEPCSRDLTSINLF